jgi:uncharacterized protein (DUF2249 family)/quercetin dioxygenase-like cupin family protein
MAGPDMGEQVLDVRQVPKPDKHPAIFAAFNALARGESFMLVNDHDPKHLREEFEDGYAGSFSWDYVSREHRNWQIKIGKTLSTALPVVLADTHHLAALTGEPDVTGAVWSLAARDRDLDANVIALRADELIDSHAGPDLDVMIHVLGGSGRLETEASTIDLRTGALIWLPRRSVRKFIAGSEGLRYLTVHKRRPALVIGTAPTGTGPDRVAAPAPTAGAK